MRSLPAPQSFPQSKLQNFRYLFCPWAGITVLHTYVWMEWKICGFFPPNLWCYNMNYLLLFACFCIEEKSQLIFTTFTLFSLKIWSTYEVDYSTAGTKGRFCYCLKSPRLGNVSWMFWNILTLSWHDRTLWYNQLSLISWAIIHNLPSGSEPFLCITLFYSIN